MKWYFLKNTFSYGAGFICFSPSIYDLIFPFSSPLSHLTLFVRLPCFLHSLNMSFLLPSRSYSSSFYSSFVLLLHLLVLVVLFSFLFFLFRFLSCYSIHISSSPSSSFRSFLHLFLLFPFYVSPFPVFNFFLFTFLSLSPYSHISLFLLSPVVSAALQSQSFVLKTRDGCILGRER